MTPAHTRLTILLAFACAGCATTMPSASAPSPGTPHVIDTMAIRAHTRVLAHDSLLGRGTGTHGERVAAAYIANEAARLGLTPVPGADSFMLPVPLRRARIEPATHLTLMTDGNIARFEHGRDFIVNTGGPRAFRDFAGGAVFLGQPIHAPALLRRHGTLGGRVAVFLGPLGPDALSIVPALMAGGVTGVILLVPDRAQYDLYVRSRGGARYFVDGNVADPVWQPDLPVLIAGPALTDALLEGVPLPPSIMEGDAASGVDLRRTVAARVVVQIEALETANVAAMLPGAGAGGQSTRFVAYTAHYDHLGVSVPDETGDSIYNGFSDNAAGVGMLLAIAEALRHAPPPHSTVFIFLAGEERGLLGASWLASAPPFPLDQIDVLINLDAGAPPAPPVSWRLAADSTAAALVRSATHVAAGHGWSITTSPATPNSDYWPFARRGVPAVFVIPGPEWENTSPDEQAALRRRWDRYHEPGDHWHPDFPFAGLGRYAQFALDIGLAAAAQH
jgi:hypothetical protein